MPNIEKGPLAAPHNAPASLDGCDASLVNHDRYGGGEIMEEAAAQRTAALCVEAAKHPAEVPRQAMKKALAPRKNKNGLIHTPVI